MRLAQMMRCSRPNWLLAWSSDRPRRRLLPHRRAGQSPARPTDHGPGHAPRPLREHRKRHLGPGRRRRSRARGPGGRSREPDALGHGRARLLRGDRQRRRGHGVLGGARRRKRRARGHGLHARGRVHRPGQPADRDQRREVLAVLPDDEGHGRARHHRARGRGGPPARRRRRRALDRGGREPGGAGARQRHRRGRRCAFRHLGDAGRARLRRAGCGPGRLHTRPEPCRLRLLRLHGLRRPRWHRGRHGPGDRGRGEQSPRERPAGTAGRERGRDPHVLDRWRERPLRRRRRRRRRRRAGGARGHARDRDPLRHQRPHHHRRCERQCGADLHRHAGGRRRGARGPDLHAGPGPEPGDPGHAPDLHRRPRQHRRRRRAGRRGHRHHHGPPGRARARGVRRHCLHRGGHGGGRPRARQRRRRGRGRAHRHRRRPGFQRRRPDRLRNLRPLRPCRRLQRCGRLLVHRLRRARGKRHRHREHDGERGEQSPRGRRPRRAEHRYATRRWSSRRAAATRSGSPTWTRARPTCR